MKRRVSKYLLKSRTKLGTVSTVDFMVTVKNHRVDIEFLYITSAVIAPRCERQVVCMPIVSRTCVHW